MHRHKKKTLAASLALAVLPHFFHGVLHPRDLKTAWGDGGGEFQNSELNLHVSHKLTPNLQAIACLAEIETYSQVFQNLAPCTRIL